jgi:hypothetical protein
LVAFDFTPVQNQNDGKGLSWKAFSYLTQAGKHSLTADDKTRITEMGLPNIVNSLANLSISSMVAKKRASRKSASKSRNSQRNFP